MPSSESSASPSLSGLPSHGWLTKAEAELLFRCASQCEGAILEVGSYHGRSTVLLARTGRTIYAVEPFAGFCKNDMDGSFAERDFREATKSFPNVKLYKQKIETWNPLPCGFCYLDGDHSYEGTITQIKKALKCKPTWIAVHDVNDSGGGLRIKRACLELLGHWHERVERLAAFHVEPQRTVRQ